MMKKVAEFDHGGETFNIMQKTNDDYDDFDTAIHRAAERAFGLRGLRVVYNRNGYEVDRDGNFERYASHSATIARKSGSVLGEVWVHYFT